MLSDHNGKAKRALAILAGVLLIASANPSVHAPNIEGRTLDGAAFSVTAMKGKVVIVNFWASWCAPCRAEMPALDRYYKAHHADGLNMIAISVDTSGKTKTVAQMALAYHFPIALLDDVTLPSAYRLAQIPVTLVFDRSGVLRFDGRRTKTPIMDGPALDRIVGPLLGEAAGQ